MVSRVDMSLEDIITSNKSAFSLRRGRGGGRGRGRRGAARGGVGKPAGRGGAGGQRRKSGQRRGVPGRGSRRGGLNAAWGHDAYFRGAAAAAITTGPTKLNISNLDFGVSDSDIKELFTEFGAMRTAAVHYDRSGRSLGTAHVVFDRRNDALKAIKQYNGVHLDGRPMIINIDGAVEPLMPSLSPRSSLGGRAGRTKRLQRGARPIGGGTRGGRGRGGSRGALSGRGAGRGGRGAGRGDRGAGRGDRSAGRGDRSAGRGDRGAGRGGRGTRGRGGGRGGRGGGRGAKAKVPTAEELDADLDAYVSEATK